MLHWSAIYTKGIKNRRDLLLSKPLSSISLTSKITTKKIELVK